MAPTTPQTTSDATRAAVKDIDIPDVGILNGPLMGEYRFVSMVPRHGEEVITLIRIPSLPERLFGAIPSVEQFHGDGTVWRSLPDHQRQGTLMESMLCDFWSAAKYARAEQKSSGLNAPR